MMTRPPAAKLSRLTAPPKKSVPPAAIRSPLTGADTSTFPFSAVGEFTVMFLPALTNAADTGAIHAKIPTSHKPITIFLIGSLYYLCSDSSSNRFLGRAFPRVLANNRPYDFKLQETSRIVTIISYHDDHLLIINQPFHQRLVAF